MPSIRHNLPQLEGISKTIQAKNIFRQNIKEISLANPINYSGSLTRVSPARGKKDAVFSLVVGDGTVGGFFVYTKDRTIAKDCLPETDSKVLILKGRSRPGERSTVAYLEWAVEKGYLTAGDLLLMDNEASFKTELVQDILRDNDIEFEYFPAYRGSIMNPCDNSFHNNFKHNYYQKLIGKTTLTKEEKLKLAREAYFEVEGKSIVNMFRHVGLTSGSPAKVAKKLLSEGHTPSSNSKSIYVEQIKAFVEWAKETSYEFASDHENEIIQSKYELL